MFFPQTLGLGYNIRSFFSAGSLAIHYVTSMALFIFLLLLAKLATSSFTIGSGGSGGVFSPSLCMGAMVGALFGMFVDSVFP